MSRWRLNSFVSFALAACLLVCLTPDTALAQYRWTVNVVSARSDTTTICTNQTFSFELSGPTGSSSHRVCNADARFTVAETTATLQLVSNVVFYGCTWQPVGTVAGTGSIVGDAVGDTTFSGSMRTTGSYYCNSTNPITITFRASRQSTTGPPVITSHPSNASAARGATASFSCAASGNPAPTFQWQRLSASGTYWADLGDAGPFGGVTSTTLAVSVPTEGTAVQAGDQFRCVATNSYGSASSNAGLLTINEPPYIIAHPSPTTVLYGDTATFTVQAGGTPAPTYRWQWMRAGTTTWATFQYDTGGFQGSQTATLTVPTGASGGQNGDQFRAVATNSLGNATSNAAMLSVTTVAPSFTTQPADTAALNGASATFTVAVTGRPTPTLQWLRSPAGSTAWEEVSAASPYSGVTGTTLTISAVTAAMHGDRFRARAVNLAGTVESNAATLSIAAPPVFTLHPASAEVNEGGSITFHVTATGIPAPTFQWQIDPPGPPPQGGSGWSTLSDNTSYAGTTTDTLTVRVVPGGSTGSAFRAVATNIAGSATSNSAILTVVLCTQTLDLAEKAFTSGGGEGTVRITTAPSGWNCTWTASSTVTWIRLRESAADVSGTNAGSVTYDVMPNLSTTARTGTVIIGRQRHTVTQAAGRIELVDPNPTLIDHRTYALFASRDLVAAEVASGRLRARTGTSTDGLSVLLVSVASELPLTFTLVTTGGRLEQVTGDAGSEFQPGGVAGDRRVVAVYRPPAYFGSNATSQTVFVEFSNPLETGAVGRVSITLERPPLVLVHGQWDSSELWRTTGFEAAMQASGFRTFNADYRDWAGASFDPDARPQRQVELVQREIENALRVTRDAGIAAAQVDVVAHSMGGLVTRALIQQPACPVSLGQLNRSQCYRHVSNFNRGWVRRLVTLGSPHNGSPVGKVLYDNRNVTLSIYGRLGETLVPLKWVVRALTGGSLEGGSAQALSPGSSAFANVLATPGCAAGDTLSVPTYGLIGDYRPAGTVRLRTLALSLLMRGLTGQSIADVFGEASDLMVGASSQWGRGAVVTFPTGAYFGSTVHSASLGSAPADGLYAEAENPDIRQKVATLLNSELDSSAAPFGCFSRPWAPAAADAPAPGRGASAVSSGRIRFTSPGFSDVITHGTGMRLTLTVEPVGGTEIRDLVFAIGNVLTVPGPSAAPYSVTVDLPASLPLGSLDVVAYALDTNDALLVDMRTVTVQASDTPSAIRVTPTTLALSAGEELGQQLRVFGSFVRNGASVDLDVSSATLGTRYAARLGSAVVTISDEGVVTAAGVGTDVIDITASGGLTASVPVTVACVVAASPVEFSVPAAGSTETLTLTTRGGDCQWGFASRVEWITIDSVSSWVGDATITFRVAANRDAVERTGSLWVSGQSVTVVQAGAPTTMAVSPSTLRFAATKHGADGAIASVTGAQAVTVAVTGATPPWTATANQPWVQITGGAATGSGIFTVQIVNPDNVIGGATTLSATVTVAAGTVLSATVQVTLSVGPVSAGSIGLIGQVDTPVQDAAGVVGAIGVTGWTLDDIGATGVKIYRNCLSFDDPESCQTVLGNSVVFVGDAAFLTGARPDVEAAFTTHPQNNRAGWGYLMLTSMLPHVTSERGYGGQGALTIYAVATDVEGNQKLLGRSSDPAGADFATPTRITMANDAIAKPFGAIDTPAQGETVSGVLNNFGWALTPDSNTTGGEPGDIVIPTDGSTMTVFIDSLPVALVAYNQCRGSVGNPVPAGLYCNDDVASIFGNATPQPTFTVRTSNPTRHRNLDAERAAIGSFTIDTATLSNGLHTIAWSVTDSAGRTEGIGSRFFNVLNGGGDAAEKTSGPDVFSVR